MSHVDLEQQAVRVSHREVVQQAVQASHIDLVQQAVQVIEVGARPVGDQAIVDTHPDQRPAVQRLPNETKFYQHGAKTIATRKNNYPTN